MNYTLGLRFGLWCSILLTILAWCRVGGFFWSGETDRAWDGMLWAFAGGGAIVGYLYELRKLGR